MTDTVQGSLRKTPVRDLLIGMYVARLDRPWAGTPFSVQGFHIRSRDDIQALRVHCHHVYVDTRRSKAVAKSTADEPAPGGAALPIARGVYDADRIPFDAEIDTARRLHRAMSRLLGDCYEQSGQGHDIPYLSLRRIGVAVVEGVCRNPDAYAWTARVYDHETWYWRDAVRAAIAAVSMGREIGLLRDRLLMLLLGSVLADIGQARLSAPTRDGLTDVADPDVRARQVELGVELLKNTIGIDDEVLTVVRAHHERYDGSGYPRGLAKDKIPLLAQVSAIAAHYERLTNPGPDHDEPLSPAAAMSQLNELRGVKFAGWIVDEFVRTLGVYPTGSLVELTGGDVAIVQQQHPERRLKPVVIRVRKRGGGRYFWNRRLDLRAQERKAPRRALEVTKSLPRGAYGVDPRALARRRLFSF